MPDVTVFIPQGFPYTFPFTFGEVDIGVQAAAHEPVLPIEYRYTLPDVFFIQEPSTWLGFIEVLQGLEELLMPIWPSEDIHATPHLYPYVFGGTTLDQLFDKDISWWQNQPTTLMPEYTSEYLYGDIHNYPNLFMQLSTPVFDPDGKGVREPVSAPLLSEGAGSVELVGPAA